MCAVDAFQMSLDLAVMLGLEDYALLRIIVQSYSDMRAIARFRRPVQNV